MPDAGQDDAAIRRSEVVGLQVFVSEVPINISTIAL